MFFFFQAEDGIRDVAVTGVQTCALPICGHFSSRRRLSAPRARPGFGHSLVGCLATDARRTFASGWASSRTSFRDEPCKRCCLYADGGGARRPRSCRKACSFSCVCRHNPIIGIPAPWRRKDRKSTRLNSSHGYISYAVFCLKKKKTIHYTHWRI